MEHKSGSKHTNGVIGLFSILVLLGMLFLPLGIARVGAEGSVGLNIIGDTSRRPVIEWRTGTTAGLYRRTFFQVYANAGETISLGSSAMGVGSGDIALWVPGHSFDSQVDPNDLPAADFLCSVSQPGNGKLDTRAKEVAGPLPNAGGYTPCVYSVTTTGLHWVAFYGPSGPNSDSDGEVGTIDTPTTGTTQNSGVSMWDITVRDSAGATKPGRSFVDYLALNAGKNGPTYRLYSTVYSLTKDGFIYKVDLNGLDPYGFILYGNEVGYLDPDGVTPLYHDAVYTDNTLTEPAQGGVKRSPATAKIFFDIPGDDLPTSVRATPVTPSVSNISFEGSAGDNDAAFSRGGVFYYRGNVGGIAEIVISRDGVDYDPTNPNNRVLRSPTDVRGVNTIVWDGYDNSGVAFPVGDDYPFRVFLHAGEYHFPMLDAENSPFGGPTITMLNPPGGVCPFNPNCHTAFYDDRGYYVTTPVGTHVGTPGATLPGDVNAVNPPSVNHSDPINGFDTSTNQRAFGDITGKGFGNWKGLDLWTYFPSAYLHETLDVVPVKDYDLNIVKSHKGAFEVSPSGGSFKLSVSNVGEEMVTGEVVVTDALPTGLTAASVSGADWTCSISPDKKSMAPMVANTAHVSNVNDTNPTNDQFTDIADVNTPTAVEMVSFSAVEKDWSVLVEWETANEINLHGFNLYRSVGLNRPRQKVNNEPIQAQNTGGMVGGSYSFQDTGTQAGQTYTYWLEFMRSGGTEFSDPLQVLTLFRVYLPLTRR